MIYRQSDAMVKKRKENGMNQEEKNHVEYYRDTMGINKQLTLRIVMAE
jgi:hypothetical protein